MIGDWVKKGTLFGQVVDIEQKEKYAVVGVELIGEGYDVYIVEDLEPIPLTQEILEKNGWKHEFDKTEYMVKYELAQKGKNCWMMWAIKEHNLDIQRQDEKLNMYNLKVQKVCIPCDYVHYLQHAIRLCEIEKEIKL